MVSILGNVKYSDGTISVLKDFSLLSSNPMGPIIGSLRIYSLLDLQIHILVCLIDVLGQISVLGGQFSEINKRPGPNKHPGRTFSEIHNYLSTHSDLKILEFSKKIL